MYIEFHLTGIRKVKHLQQKIRKFMLLYYKTSLKENIIYLNKICSVCLNDNMIRGVVFHMPWHH